MNDAGCAFIDHSRHLLTDDYLPRIERCLETLSEENIWWRPNAESNSIGNLVLHMAGNARQWLVSGVGCGEDRRDRQREFDERGPIPSSDLIALLREAITDADSVLAGLDGSELSARHTIQGTNVTRLEAIYHAVEHFSMHTGQIILLTKMWSGDLGFYHVEDGVATPTWTTGR